jgi:tight adherence protein C
MDEWGWFAITAGGVAVVCLLVTLVVTRKPNRRGNATPAEADDDPTTALILGDMTETLAKGLPGETRDREEILPELLRAGYYSESALAQYRAIRAVLILSPLFAAGAIALLVTPTQMPYVGLGGLLLAVVGYSIPRVYVTLKAQSRSREIERGLPVFADMLSLALLAGQGLLTAISRVAGQLRLPFPRMAEELELVRKQAELLNLAAAFDRWAVRSQLTEVRNLAVILNQSARLGNDISTALMEYATSLRTGVRHRVEAQAQRATFWMLFPTILCLWIPAAVLLIAPVYLEFAARRAKAREAMPDLGKNSQVGKILRTKENQK